MVNFKYETKLKAIFRKNKLYLSISVFDSLTGPVSLTPKQAHPEVIHTFNIFCHLKKYFFITSCSWFVISPISTFSSSSSPTGSCF